jgi:hypothetical protein
MWKGLRAQDYEPDAATVSVIRQKASDVDVFIVLATWCPDTRRDLPRFFKIADQTGWPAGRSAGSSRGRRRRSSRTSRRS